MSHHEKFLEMISSLWTHREMMLREEAESAVRDEKWNDDSLIPWPGEQQPMVPEYFRRSFRP